MRGVFDRALDHGVHCDSLQARDIFEGDSLP
jgi:hypothetical protein